MRENRYRSSTVTSVRTLEVASIEIDEEHRNQGHCQRFLEWYESLARSRGRTLYVESVLSTTMQHIMNKRGYTEDPKGTLCFWKD